MCPIAPRKGKTHFRTFSLRCLALASLLMFTHLRMLSQTYKGSIVGTVTDTTGVVVPGATVTIIDAERGIKRTLITDEAGAYSAPDLLPSTYSVQVAAKGFATVKRPAIELQVAQILTINFTLKPGAVSETVVVSAGAPLINVSEATLGGTLSNQTINDLPLNGRSFMNLLALRPGVMIYPGGGFQTQSSNGIRPTDVGYLLDGLMGLEPFQGQSVVNQAGFAGDASTILPIDAIQQFNVIENPPAEYGWAPGSVVNVALKSGTNQFHGTGYAFGRDSSWDARNFFNTQPQAQTPLDLEQYGGTAGGPILKDKLFFFTGYEGQRYSVGNTFNTSIPVSVSLAPSNPATANCTFIASGDCAASIPDAIADLQAGGFNVNSVSQKLVTLFPVNPGPSPVIPLGFPNSVKVNNGVAKLDYHINEHNQVSYDYFIGDQSGTVETRQVVAPEFLSLISEKVQAHGVHWTWDPNPRWVNEFRLGYDRFRQGPTTTADSSTPATSFGINTGVTDPVLGGLPNIIINGFTESGDGIGGDFTLPKVLGTDQIYELDDTVSYLHGSHAFSFGTNLQHYVVTAGRFSNGRGKLKFGPGFLAGPFDSATPLEAFLAGNPFLGIIQHGHPLRRVNQWASAFFFEDSWRATRTLTVNMGLRYSYTTPMREAHGLLGNFDPNVGLIQQGVGGVDTVYRGDPTDVEPRLGFAWNPGGGNTVIRGGANLMDSRIDLFSLLSQLGPTNALTTGLAAVPTGAPGLLPGGTIDVGLLVLPGSQLNYTAAGPVFSSGLSCTSDSPCSLMAVDRDLRNPSVISWSLGIQHAFGSHLSLETNYVGNHGRNLLGIRDINQVDPNSPAEIACRHCEQAGRPLATKFPYLNFINMMSNQDESNYNGLQITLNERDFHGLTLLAGYTWSHAFDDASTDAFAFQPQNSLRPGLEYANSDYDIRHRLTLTTTYVVPGRKGFGQLLEGWHITSIVTLQGGQPWYASDVGDDISLTGEFNDRWDFFGNASDFDSGPQPIPFFLPGTPSPGDPLGPTDPAFAINNAACASNANSPGLTASLLAFGCYAKGKSALIPPAQGTFGTMGRNVFRGSGFYNWDASIFKDLKFGERFTAQFRAEFFNVLNHPLFANPYGGANGFAQNDASSPGTFGCGCATPDVAASNPVLGSGGARAIQFGLKLLF